MPDLVSLVTLRRAIWILGVAMVASVAATMFFSRGTTFSGDEMVWVITSPSLDLTTLFTGHGGHLQVVSRGVYKILLELFGLSYLPYRLLTAATICLSVGLLFVWLKRRVPPAVALLPCLVLLFFGSDHLHVLQGNGFTILFAMSMGLVAMLALERNDRAGDLVAAVALVVGVATYSIALAFVAAVLVQLVLERSWKRLWVPALPIVLYAVWLVWAKTSIDDGGLSSVQISNLLLVPAWCFQALGAVMGSLTGVAYSFTGTPGMDGSILAALAVPTVLLLGYLVWRFGMTREVLSLLALVVTLWVMQALVARSGGGPASDRLPTDARYMYPGAIAVVMLLAAAARKVQWTQAILVALVLITVAGLGTNVMLLRDNGSFYRQQALDFKAGASVYELGASAVVTEDAEPASADEIAKTSGAVLLGMLGLPYGQYSYSNEELRNLSEPERQTIDSRLAGNLGLAFSDASRQVGICKTVRGQDGRVLAKLPFGNLTIESDTGGAANLGRLADAAAFPVGTLPADKPVALELPGPGTLPDRWFIEASGSTLRVCK